MTFIHLTFNTLISNERFKLSINERRKLGEDCPEYIEAKKGIMFPAQNIIIYQLEKSKQCVKVVY